MHHKMALPCEYHINRTEMSVLFQEIEVLQCMPLTAPNMGPWTISPSGGIAPAPQDNSRNAQVPSYCACAYTLSKAGPVFALRSSLFALLGRGRRAKYICTRGSWESTVELGRSRTLASALAARSANPNALVRNVLSR